MQHMAVKEQNLTDGHWDGDGLGFGVRVEGGLAVDEGPEHAGLVAAGVHPQATHRDDRRQTLRLLGNRLRSGSSDSTSLSATRGGGLTEGC